MARSPAGSVSELFERHGAMVFRRCRQLLGEQAAEDAVQEVFLRATKAWSRFRGDASPMTWLYRIATTHCLQQIRNDRSRAAKLELIAPRLEEIEDLASKVDLAALFAELDAMTQQVVLLRHVDGMTLEEVADVCGISRKTVQKKLARFVEQAKKKLEVKA